MPVGKIRGSSYYKIFVQQHLCTSWLGITKRTMETKRLIPLFDVLCGRRFLDLCLK